MNNEKPGERAKYFKDCFLMQCRILSKTRSSCGMPEEILRMNDMWSRIKRINDWHAKAIVTGDFSNAPLADIACVSNFARERLREIEDMSDQELRLRVIKNPVGFAEVQKGGST